MRLTRVLVAALIGLILTASPAAHAQSVSTERSIPQNPTAQVQQAAIKPALGPIACDGRKSASFSGSMAAGTCFKDCPDVCPEMIVIPAGSFTMGAAESEQYSDEDERPLHTVSIGRAFGLGKYPVTKAEFAAFVRSTGHGMSGECWGWTGTKGEFQASRSWQNAGFAQTDRDPVVCVNWNDAQAYAQYLSSRTGALYRLPSEAEWEYAARAGTTTQWYWGDTATDACRFANVLDARAKSAVPGAGRWNVVGCDDGYAYTSPVGSFPPNGFGLFDMLGNAFQWTQDCWNDTYQGAPSDEAAWTSGSCNLRVLRGGSWFTVPSINRAGHRVWLHANRTEYSGFRVARTFTP